MYKRKSFRFLVTMLVLLGLVVPSTAALADGTETLGEPSITLAEGTGYVAAGAGLIEQPGEFELNVPPGEIKQVLLYWEGHGDCGKLPSPCPLGREITVNGVAIHEQPNIEIIGIGGPTFFYNLNTANMYSLSYRADITDLGLVEVGNNALSITGVSLDVIGSVHGDAPGFANGASVVVIYDDGGISAEIAIRDGNDNAFLGFEGDLKVTVPQEFSFAPEPAARTADLTVLVGSVESPDWEPSSPRPNRVLVTINDGEQEFINDLSSADGPSWDTLNLTVNIPAGASNLTVEIESFDDGSEFRPASLSWVAAVLSAPVSPAARPAVFLIIDEDSIDNGIRFHENPIIGQQNIFPGTKRQFSDKEVNDDIAKYGQRSILRYFQANPGKTIALMTGQTGDEGWFAPTQIPMKWGSTQQEGLSNFIAGTVKQDHLDKIPGVRPLRAMGLKELEGRTVCAVVYDSDISINYDSKQPFTDGNLQGATLGIAAFTVLNGGVNQMKQFSSSTLPEAQIRIEDAQSVCSSPLELFDAPIPRSSSEPNDINPLSPPSKGYRNR
jgi:hypothetical protein